MKTEQLKSKSNGRYFLHLLKSSIEATKAFALPKTEVERTTSYFKVTKGIQDHEV